MKNKKSIYLLLFVVLLVWGAVIYRFFNFSPDLSTDETVTTSKILPKKNITEVKNDTHINVNYRDPFLGKAYSSEPQKHIFNVVKPANKVIINVPPHAVITYKGMVSDNKNKKKVFMVNIDGNNYLMSEKQIEENVTVVTGNRTQITVKYRNKKETYKLEP